MKKLIAIALAALMLTGCAAKEAPEQIQPTQTEAAIQETVPAPTYELVAETQTEMAYASRFDSVTEIVLNDGEITVSGNEAAVSTSHDIVFYEDKDVYDSGNPYGEGEDWERHAQAEADGHTVVNITQPGAYRVTGKLSQGQIRIDLGDMAYDNADSVVELILKDADITCTVAPAILFENVYECDGNWSADTAKAEVDTSAAGANLILEGENVVNGSHVAKIFKDKEGQKKLWKQDGAIYSYMSMNVFGPGKLDLTADNEGLDTELHLTINGGDIAIRADNDGINTNEDGVSVTTINGGNIHIIAGLGAEGDGIDSNGYLVINGGMVVSSANPGADAGLDSDLGSYVNGGTVIALGSTMDWAESDSQQVTMNLQFSQNQSSEAAVVITREDGTVIFAYDPSDDEVLAGNKRVYSGAVISCANFHVGEAYNVYADGQITGSDLGGIYDVTTVTGFTGGIQMAYTGTDVMMRPGGMGFGGQMPVGMEGFDPQNLPEGMERGQMPEGMENFTPGQMPEGMENFDFSQFDGQRPEGMENFEPQSMPEGMENFAPGQMPEGMEGMVPPNGFGGFDIQGETGEANTSFYMQDMVNAFSGLANV